MRLMTSQSMPGVVSTALTVALETADGIGDTDGVDKDGVRITHWVMSLNVRERYSPDKRGERVTGVSGSISDDGELNGDEGTDDDGGEYDIGDDKIDEDDSLGTGVTTGRYTGAQRARRAWATWGWCQRDCDDPRTRFAGHRGGEGWIIRCSTRFTKRYDAASSNRAVFEMDRREWYNLWDLLFMHVLKEPVDIIRDNDTRTLGRWPFRSCPFGRSSLNKGATFEGMMVVLCVDKRDGSVGTSSKMGSSKRDRLSKISDPKEMEDAVETEDGVLVNTTWDRSGVSMGDETVVEDGAQREGEGTVGGALGDRDGVADAETDIDTVPAGDGDGSAGAETNIDTIGVREGEDGDE
ncbi:hypothetical protein EDB85DRAFT_2230378, partial [Lactarius pseudohatsudake]